jgi:hypothetical protein
MTTSKVSLMGLVSRLFACCGSYTHPGGMVNKSNMGTRDPGFTRQ